MCVKRLDIQTEIEYEAVRILLATDPDPEGDPTYKQVKGLIILLKEGLKDREHLRLDVLRIITGVPLISQWGLSSWAHHVLIDYFKEDNDEPKWSLSLRGRRLIAECANVAEAFTGKYEDDLDKHRAEANMRNVWEADRKVSA